MERADPSTLCFPGSNQCAGVSAFHPASLFARFQPGGEGLQLQFELFARLDPGGVAGPIERRQGPGDLPGLGQMQGKGSSTLVIKVDRRDARRRGRKQRGANPEARRRASLLRERNAAGSFRLVDQFGGQALAASFRHL